MNPKRALPHSHRSKEGTAIRGENGVPFFGGSKRNLLRRPGGKTLPPDVVTAAGIDGEIHPVSIRRPRGGGTLASCRSHRLARLAKGADGSVLEWHQPAGAPAALHLNYQHVFAIRRKERPVSHGVLRGRFINHAASGTVHGSGDDRHVRTAVHLREQNPRGRRSGNPT